MSRGIVIIHLRGEKLAGSGIAIFVFWWLVSGFK
jgi:hypothetical protein